MKHTTNTYTLNNNTITITVNYEINLDRKVNLMKYSIDQINETAEITESVNTTLKELMNSYNFDLKTIAQIDEDLDEDYICNTHLNETEKYIIGCDEASNTDYLFNYLESVYDCELL